MNSQYSYEAKKATKIYPFTDSEIAKRLYKMRELLLYKHNTQPVKPITIHIIWITLMT